MLNVPVKIAILPYCSSRVAPQQPQVQSYEGSGWEGDSNTRQCYVREWRSQRNLSTLKWIKLGHCPLLLATPQTGAGTPMVLAPPPALTTAHTTAWRRTNTCASVLANIMHYCLSTWGCSPIPPSPVNIDFVKNIFTELLPVNDPVEAYGHNSVNTSLLYVKGRNSSKTLYAPRF